MPAWQPREAWLRSHMVLGFPVRGGERCLPSARGAPAAFWSFPVLLGCWGVCVCVRAQPVWVLISSRGEQNRRQRGHSAASRSFWFRDTLTSRNVQTSKGRWRGSCRSPWESSGQRQDPRGMTEEGPLGTGLLRPPPIAVPLACPGVSLPPWGHQAHSCQGDGSSCSPSPPPQHIAHCRPARQTPPCLPQQRGRERKMSIVPRLAPAPGTRCLQLPCSGADAPGACTAPCPKRNPIGSSSPDRRRGKVWV